MTEEHNMAERKNSWTVCLECKDRADAAFVAALFDLIAGHLNLGKTKTIDMKTGEITTAPDGAEDAR